MKINKRILIGLSETSVGETVEGFTLIENKINGNRRWSINYGMVFKKEDDGSFYSSVYSVGATELQDESPYEYDGDEVECIEVVPQEVTIINYTPKAA